MDWANIAKELLLVLLGGGVGGALVQAWATRSKTKAEAHLKNAQAEDVEAQAEQKRAGVYQQLVEGLHTELNGLRGEVGELRTNQAANIKHIGELQDKDARWEKRCNEMQAQLNSTQAQLTVLQAERQEWKDGIDTLIAQLIELEIKPKWTRKGTKPLP